MLSDVRDFIKTITDCGSGISCGMLDSNKDCALAVYNSKNAGSPIIAIGGTKQTGYGVKPISLLVHWGNNAAKAEQKATEIYALVEQCKMVQMGKTLVYFTKMLDSGPVAVGRDTQEIYEYVIDFSIYFERMI